MLTREPNAGNDSINCDNCESRPKELVKLQGRDTGGSNECVYLCRRCLRKLRTELNRELGHG